VHGSISLVVTLQVDAAHRHATFDPVLPDRGSHRRATRIHGPRSADVHADHPAGFTPRTSHPSIVDLSDDGDHYDRMSDGAGSRPRRPSSPRRVAGAALALLMLAGACDPSSRSTNQSTERTVATAAVAGATGS
jgi:hypothetical protein